MFELHTTGLTIWDVLIVSLLLASIFMWVVAETLIAAHKRTVRKLTHQLELLQAASSELSYENRRLHEELSWFKIRDVLAVKDDPEEVVVD